MKLYFLFSQLELPLCISVIFSFFKICFHVSSSNYIYSKYKSSNYVTYKQKTPPKNTPPE